MKPSPHIASRRARAGSPRPRRLILAVPCLAVLCLALLSLVAAPPPALAQTQDQPAGWEELSRQGDEAIAAKDYAGAVRLFSAAMEDYGLKTALYGQMQARRGEAYYFLRQEEKAERDISAALKYSLAEPTALRIRHMRALMRASSGRAAQAIGDYDILVRLAPDNFLLYIQRGEARSRLARYRGALDDFTEAIRLAPDRAEGYNSKAWLLATCPRASCRSGEEALRLAQSAVGLRATSYTLNTLAAAQAEAGQFDEAVRTLDQAIEKLQAEGRTGAIPLYRKMQEGFRANRPWREGGQ